MRTVARRRRGPDRTGGSLGLSGLPYEKRGQLELGLIPLWGF